MNKKEFVQTMDQIHLEVSLLEILVCQTQANADENNLNILLSALANADDKAVLTEENGINEQLCRLAFEFQELCRAAIKNPSLLKPFPKLYNATFQVLLRALYLCYLSEEIEATMSALADVLIAADDFVSDEEFHAFLYWFESYNLCWEKIMRVPRVLRQLENFPLLQNAFGSRSVQSLNKKKKGGDDGSLLN